MATSLPILTFHSLDDRSSILSFSPQVFRRGIARLYESGYKTMSLLEAVGCLRRGKGFPDRSLVITFDDGYQSVYEEAFPTLDHYGMSATIFLAVGERKALKPDARLHSLNTSPMLSWYEIRRMYRSGIHFGAHTLTHPDLTRLSVDRLIAEVYESKAIVEELLGGPAASFAYPYGRYDRRTREIVERYFACACTDKLALITADSDPYALERVDAFYLRSNWLFDMIPTGFFPWYVRALSIPRRLRRAFQLSLNT